MNSAPGIDEVIRTRSITSVYQPIVELDTRNVVAFEALARGPKGTPWESPDRMFAAAARHDLVTELDWACRAAAMSGALDARLGRGVKLFVNVEPAALRSPRPQGFGAVADRAARELSMVFEVTERAVVDDPAALIHVLAEIRSTGVGIAIDDVGAEHDSLALLPFVAPDVIKLDMRLVKDDTDDEVASIANAVRADAERRGACILAEGIETKAHLDRALVLGAQLGQGWLFGRPGPLPAISPSKADGNGGVVRLRSPQDTPETPWSLVADWDQRRRTSKRLLMPMSHHVEQSAATGEPRVILSAFQNFGHFTEATRRRYEELAVRHSMVGAVATGMVKTPGIGVRGGSLPVAHPLAGEWTVTVVGPHDAAALIARERFDAADDVDDDERLFDYVITHHRETVVTAARSLLRYIDAT